MFESPETVLEMLGIYAVVGFFLAVVYNILRFFRLMLPKMRKASAVTDFLFAITAGFVLFAFSVDRGMGFFRLYYVAAAAFGFAVNMLTLGFAVPPLARAFRRVFGFAADKIAHLLIKPAQKLCAKITYCLGKIRKNISEIAEKRKIHLQMRRQMMYNINDHKIGEVYPEGGENRNAIKAKVRKIV